MVELKVVSSREVPAKKKRAKPFAPRDIVHVESNPEVLMTVEISNEKETVCWYPDDAGEFRSIPIPTVVLRKYVEPRE